MRKRDNGHVSIAECPYPEVDDPLSSPAQSPSINSVPPSAMAAAAAAAGIDAVNSVSSLDSDDSSILAGSSAAGLGPPTFGSSFVSDDDPYAWAQKLRRIPDKVCTPAPPPKYSPLLRTTAAYYVFFLCRFLMYVLYGFNIFCHCSLLMHAGESPSWFDHPLPLQSVDYTSAG